MRIRRFRMADYAAVRRVWTASGLEVLPGDSEAEVRVKLRRDPELFLVAEEGGALVGTVLGGWDGRRGWIYHLGVLPGRQGKGIASALLAELERRMRAKGVLKVNALIHDDNERSLRLFAKLGFTPDRRSVQHWKVLKPKGEPDRP